MTEPTQPSSVERIKSASNYLRGNLAAELENDLDHFDKDTSQLLKHHGMYQQDNRDQRVSKVELGKKSGKSYSLMVRVKIPAGRLSAAQFLAQLDLCDAVGNGTARLTDRQDIQLHGVLKKDIRQALRRINEVQLTTFGACGDVERNVLSCPAPLADGIRGPLADTAQRLSDLLLPRTRAYHEVWLGEEGGPRQRVDAAEAVAGAIDDVEPLYGKTYLPRKFKIALSLPDDNCTDVYANDLGFLADCRDGGVQGYNVLVGGGFGMTPSNKNTFPAVALTMGYIEADQIDAVAIAVVKAQRDHGDRSDRKRARLKYVLADRGLAWFKDRVEEHYGRRIADPRPLPITGVEDHLGWFAQGDGRWCYGLNVENGRILDREGMTLKSALRDICREFNPGVRITAQQSLLLADLPIESRDRIEAILVRHGVKRSEDYTSVRRWSMACVAMPTCPLAVAESERTLPGLMDQFEAELARLGLADEVFTTRMTGCPNGCARTYTADVGLVGRTAGKYTIYLGGRLLGDRLGFLFKDVVPLEQVVPTLVPVLARFKEQRQDGETFGDFCHRLGKDGLG